MVAMVSNGLLALACIMVGVAAVQQLTAFQAVLAA
jgi:hypothetical protein